MPLNVEAALDEKRNRGALPGEEVRGEKYHADRGWYGEISLLPEVSKKVPKKGLTGVAAYNIDSAEPRA